MRLFTFWIVLLFGLNYNYSFGQGSGGVTTNKIVGYKILTDEPYGINKLWLHFQPIVADVYTSNLTLGWGLQVNYFIMDKLDAKVLWRGAYGQRFDLARDAAVKNSIVYWREKPMKVINDFNTYTNLEFGLCYHIIDTDEKKGSTRFALMTKKRRMREFSVADEMKVTTKVRHITGVRLGGIFFASTIDLNPVLSKQKVALPGSDGSLLLPDASTAYPGTGRQSDRARNRVYGNLNSNGLYVGGNWGTIRNVSIKADKFGNIANNIMFNAYSDIIVSPWTGVQDINVKVDGTPSEVLYNTDPIKINKLGWRAGFDVMYNQDFYWSFGGEMGLRPGPAKRAFYVCAKIAFPVFAFKFNRQRIANNTGSLQK